ncbi:hypothetical protein JOF48_000634 [Arthrobacter stackebrandtii]|uniref:DUF4240 domain-containing protein n=1 Tax=Arthrobacter stackebrandtii TaxID=272161 RepID=A0ABS4YSR7_9MICC|nr:hypothetical protein [Arthrobacter stackebrandtii]MBP2411835.1 hypothetical protein [Arthrobacter stackebrandtii]PYG99128.1 hypothetical protein CVV67_17195 [Arthrobacter stackebrandtii]
MWGSLEDGVEIDIEALAPKLLREWLGRDSAAGLMDYLWTSFLGDRAVAEEGLENAEDALHFLAIAKLAAEALDIASGSDSDDAWAWVEVPETLIHPFAVGYLLATQGQAADLQNGLGGNLTALIETYESEVLRSLASKLSETDFFIAIWSAHLGIREFPPGGPDMAEHDFYLDTATADQGRLLDQVSNAWPAVPRAIAYAGDPLF